MKTNISIYVDDRKATDTCPVYIKVSRGRNERFLVNTGLTSSGKFEGHEFPKWEKNSIAKTKRLGRLLTEVEDICMRRDDMPLKQLKKLIQERVFGKVEQCKAFTYYCREYASGCATRGTASLYEQTARKVEAFDKDATFDTITVSWLRNFERFCRQTMSVNGMGILIRNIRTVFNQARKDEITNKYPFLNYSIKKEETRKRNLTVEQIRMLRDIPCKTERFGEYRDMFMLMFYLIGINGKDLFLAKKDQIVNGRLEYRRAKTGKLYSIKIEPEAMAIINKYSGKEYIINILERYNTYQEYMRRMDRCLKQIGVIDNLSTYYARHSWATIAAEIDITFEVISAALGHSIANPTTAIYINFNQRKVDEANRKVIDYVFA